MENKPKTNSAAIVALVCGIVAVVFAFLGLYLSAIGIACAIVALIFAIKGRKEANQKGMATAGLVLGIIGCVLCPIFFGCNLCVVCAANEVSNAIDEAVEELEDYDWDYDYDYSDED